MVRGAGVWRTGSGGVHRVDPTQVLILNHGQDYSFTLDGDEGPTETFCPFFSDELVRDAAAARLRPASALLEGATAEAPMFVERLRRPDARLAALLGRLRGHLRRGAVSASVACMHELVDAVMDAALDERAQIQAVAAVRPSTREEIFRRVHQAVDFAHANLGGPLPLGSLARSAAMSPHHFHRAFHEVVGVPPGRYVSELRLDRARRLLGETGRSVTEVCLEVGFESLGSFSASFRRRYGCPPSAVRRNKQA
jgi:AraC-like DNA-binding protein